jgi:nicotinamidase/pyrazinamidase
VADNEALIIVDVQLDFCEGGALAVPQGDEVVPVINKLVHEFPHIVATQDWHPPGHTSFASAHPGKEPGDVVPMTYGEQRLWPDHCVQGENGAALHPGLHVETIHAIIRKGMRVEIDSYSAFFENDRRTPTGLVGYLHALGVTKLYLVGLALDYCVRYTAVDGRHLGFAVSVIEEGCRGFSTEEAWEKMGAEGIVRA